MSSTSIEEVLDQELSQVETSRNLRLGANPQRCAAEKSLIGLAFSGGGIRSATFNLGILQGLAKPRILRAFDYISTVSGGGYISGWLMGWLHHQGIGIHEVENRLSAQPQSAEEGADPPEVHFLRNYSNYLTPRKGLLGADFWAFAGSYLRNTVLNQIILVLALLSVLLVPRSLVFVLHALEDAEESFHGSFSENIQQYLQSQNFALALGLLLGFVAVVFMGLNLVTVDSSKSKRDCWFTHQWAVQVFIVVPLFLCCALFTYGLGQFLTQWGILAFPKYRAPMLGIALYFGQWSGAFIIRQIVRNRIGLGKNGGPKAWVVLSTAAITGAIIGYLFIPFSYVLIPGGTSAGTTYNKWHIMTFGVPITVCMMLLAGVLHIGLMGRGMSDSHREWWARLGGWLLIYSFGWLFLFLIAIYFPAGLGKVLCWEAVHRGRPVTFTSIVVWIASTIYGVLFGKSKDTNHWIPDMPFTKKIPGYLAKVTPYIFIVGLLMALSLLAGKISNWLIGKNAATLALPDDVSFAACVPIACVLLFAAAVILSWRVDVNEFSVHYLYRNRLVRCYLGASVPKRNAQPFTGFSEADNFPLKTLQIPVGSMDPKDARPLPILNTSLNVVRGKELALQTRKARSFAFTPLFSGFTRESQDSRKLQSFFAATEKGASKLPGFKDGITLGTAVAISGAAASPNMGSYSEPALAFLMTLFDVRLGWWIGNPGGQRWRNGSPAIGFYWLLRELLGSTNDYSSFVYLSDGGHFENLGVYELVRRKCKLIVACDASCDPNYSFGDLHNAIERCRTDFGVNILLDGLSLLSAKTEFGEVEGKPPQAHFAIGKIRYNPDIPEEDGTIIYLKPAFAKGDPDDVLGYAKKNAAFPHDTTANQWFDETHFENYRALGKAVGTAASNAIAEEIDRVLDRKN